MSAKLLTPQPIKWHGGKGYLANEIVKLFPPRCRTPNAPAAGDTGYLHFVEPYFGGGAVLLANDPTGVSEVANDLNGDLACFWTILQNPVTFKHFQRHLEGTPFSEDEWVDAGILPDSAVDYSSYGGITVVRALKFFVRCRQSLAGRMRGFTGITRTRTRRGMSNEVSAWLTAVEGLPAVHARLRRVLILNRPALDVIRGQDGPQTLYYLDPPYLHTTRATTGEYGAHEMTTDQHYDLLNVLADIKGRFLLSGYRSVLYDNFAKGNGWRRHDFDLPNAAAGGKVKRRMTECVWKNY